MEKISFKLWLLNTDLDVYFRFSQLLFPLRCKDIMKTPKGDGTINSWISYTIFIFFLAGFQRFLMINVLLMNLLKDYMMSPLNFKENGILPAPL